MDKEAYITEKLLAMSESALLIKLADMLYNAYDKPADKQLARMRQNVANLLMKRNLSPICKELAHLVFLA